MRLSLVRPILLFVTILIASVGCQATEKSKSTSDDITRNGKAELARLYKQDAALQPFVAGAYGYAIFPTVAKGGVVLGGAYGWGEVYELGVKVGHADLAQGTIGLQLGGQAATELIVFQTKESLDKFKSQKATFAANATAVIIDKGTPPNAKHEYKDGVAVFLSPKGGAMFEAAIGGQTFMYKPIEGVTPPVPMTATGATTNATTLPITTLPAIKTPL